MHRFVRQGDRLSFTHQRAGLSRRRLLRAGTWGVLAIPVAAPLLSGCTTDSTPPAPDPLAALVDTALTNLRTVQAIAAAFPDNASTLNVVAAMYQRHASALAAEVDRARITPTTTGTTTTSSAAPAVPSSESAAMAQLVQDLRTAQEQAANLITTLPRYRAGLVGSVSGGCASMVEALG